VTAYPDPIEHRYENLIIDLRSQVKNLQARMDQLSRSSLGLGGSAVLNVGTTTGTVAAGDDSRMVNSAILLTGLALSAQKPSTGNLTLSTSVQDVAGCTITFSVSGAHAFAAVSAAFDFQPTISSAGINAVGYLTVDGSSRSQQAIWTDNGANSRQTTPQSWLVALSAGSHTLKLQANKTGAAGTHVANSPHTNMTVLVVDLP